VPPFGNNAFKNYISQDTLSLVVIEESSREIVAGDFLFSLFETSELRNDLTQLHDVMEPIFRLIKFIEEPVHCHLASRSMGRILYNYCLFVDLHLSPTEQIQICHAIESEVICVAQSRGFSAVVTNNTNPATQVS